MGVYQECFDARGEPLRQEGRFFLATIPDGSKEYGNAEAVVACAIASMDDLFISRSGNQLGFQVAEDSSGKVAALTWRDGKAQKNRAVLITDGRHAVASDPCFFPLILGVGMEDNTATRFDGYATTLPWLRGIGKLRVDGSTFPMDFAGLMVEDIISQLQRKVHPNIMAARRSFF